MSNNLKKGNENYQSRPRKGSEKIIQGLYESQLLALREIADSRGDVPSGNDVLRKAVGLYVDNELRFRKLAEARDMTVEKAMQMALDWFWTAIMRDSGEIANSKKEDSEFEELTEKN